MNKLNLTLTSLVAAIPALVLTILLVMGFVNYAGGPTGVKVIAGLTLLVAAGLAFMPAGIFFLSGPRAEKAPKVKEEKKAEAPESEAAVAVADDELVAEEDASFEVDEEMAVADSEDFTETIAQPSPDEGDEFAADFDLDTDEDAGTKKK